MDSQLVISVKDLLLFILWGGIVTIFVYLIMILRHALKVVKSVNGVITDNRQSIDDTLTIVPDLAKHVETITGEVAHDVKAFRPTVDNIAETSHSITDTLKENQGFVDGLSSFMHTVSIGKVLYDRYFSGKMHDIKDAANEVNEAFRDAGKNAE